LSKALVIGAGPSLEKNNQWGLIKKFKGVIISTDFMLKKCIENNVIPQYVCTAENTKRITDFFIREGIHSTSETVKDALDKVSQDIVCVTSRKTHEEVQKVLDSRKWKYVIRVEDEELDRSSNVGLFCYTYAWKYLKAKEVVLVGMDHAKEEGWAPGHTGIDLSEEFVLYEHSKFKTKQYMDPKYQFFRNEFLASAAKRPCRTINATEGGSLEGPGIECMTLREYL